MANQVVNVGRATVVLTLTNGKKVSFPIQGHYITRTTGTLNNFRSVIIPVNVSEEFKRLKELWGATKVIQHLSDSWKLGEDVVNVELINISDFNLVVP